VDFFFARLPEAAADAVLAMGGDFNPPMTVAHRGLNALLEDTGIYAKPIFHSGENFCRFKGHGSTFLSFLK
jgi:hypothetical protein